VASAVDDQTSEAPWVKIFFFSLQEKRLRFHFKHPFEQKVLEQMIFHTDGAVAKWVARRPDQNRSRFPAAVMNRILRLTKV
jgi:hypothetical protein